MIGPFQGERILVKTWSQDIHNINNIRGNKLLTIYAIKRDR